MLTVILVGIVVGLAGWVWLLWRNRRQYWAKRGVPHSAPHPVLGSLTFLTKENPIVWLRRIYEQFAPAPYIGMWLFWRPGLVVLSPEIARNILVKDSDAFRNRLVGGGENDPIGSLNVFTVNDPLWSTFRRRLTPVFTAAKLRGLYPLMMQKSKDLVQRIKLEKERKNDNIDLRNIYTDYTTDVIGIASFGINSDATLTGDSPIRRVTKEFMQYSLWRSFGWCFIFFLPEVVRFFRFTFFPKSSTDYFRRVFSAVVQQRGGWQRESENRDLLDALVRIKKEASADGEEITEDMLVAQAAVFLQGGFDTSANALTFTTYELAFNSDVQEKLYAELKEAKEKQGTADFDSSALSELTYLNCVIKESLRKYPAMGWLDRVASRRYKVDEHLTIEAGTPVYVCAAGMQSDPRYFPEPEKYRPERFLPENEAQIQPFTYIPFGEGPRNCIGMRFAQQSLRSVLAHMVLNYKLKMLPGALAPTDVPFDRRGLFLSPERQLSVEFVPRE